MAHTLLTLAASYLLGCIPVGYLLARYRYGIDIRTVGSGNIGTTNILRTLGWGPALLVLLGDAGKGALAVGLARWLTNQETVMLLAGIAAVAGHNWSIFLRLKGGRGVATSLGVLVVLMPQVAALLFLLWLIVLVSTRYVSVASMSAAVLFPFLVWFFHFPPFYLGASLLLSLFALYRHLPNLKRLLAGQEHRFGQKVSEGKKSDTNGKEIEK